MGVAVYWCSRTDSLLRILKSNCGTKCQYKTCLYSPPAKSRAFAGNCATGRIGQDFVAIRATNVKNSSAIIAAFREKSISIFLLREGQDDGVRL